MYCAPNPCDPYFILFAVQQQWNNYCGLSGVKYLALILTKAHEENVTQCFLRVKRDFDLLYVFITVLYMALGPMF